MKNAAQDIRHSAPKDKNVQERKTRKGYLDQEPERTTENAAKRSAWLATSANPERRRGIVPAHDTGRKMVKTPPSPRPVNRQQITFDPASLDAKCSTMRAENAPVYATKQAIRLPRVVLSMGMTGTRWNEVEGNHSDGLDSVSAAAGGGELTSPALSLSASRAASALWSS